MKYEIVRTTRFKKDYNLAKKRGYNIENIKIVISILANGLELPRKCKDHQLSGEYENFRECHIEPDWLLVYRIDKVLEILELRRTGTHSDLFNK